MLIRATIFDDVNVAVDDDEKRHSQCTSIFLFINIIKCPFDVVEIWKFLANTHSRSSSSTS